MAWQFCITLGAEMDGLYLGGDLYHALVARLVPVAGTGNAEQIKAILGALTPDRLVRLVDYLAHLEPCPVTGIITENEIKIALGEAGGIWPREIYADVVMARLEHLEKQRDR
jgi:hypothetical protein